MKKINPEKVIKFLDANKDGKISKKEAEKSKKLLASFNYLDTNKDGFLTLNELKSNNSSNRYSYLESDGIFMYFETEEKELYRKLLPKQFDMPERLLVHTFICDFFKMDEHTQPYKEASIFLLAKYNEKEIWHCIYMPVTSLESMILGKNRLGLPKTMGEIEINRSEPEYKASVTDHNNCKISLTINTKNHAFNQDEIKVLKELSVLPKMNILNNQIIEMSGGRKENVFDLAKKYPSKIIIKSGLGSLDFNNYNLKGNKQESPLSLKPSKILGAYYMLNKFPFKLSKK
ncbi:MAG: acetoacetate decarboxylase family protein [Flavobacteriales bacterium]